MNNIKNKSLRVIRKGVSKVKNIRVRKICIWMLVFPLLFLGNLVVIFFFYKEATNLVSIKNEMENIGQEIQIGYHREFTLIERLNLIDSSEFKKNCEVFSFNCLYNGSNLRKQFLEEIKTENFSDNDIEVLNMISSMDVSLKSNSLKYENLVKEYNAQINKFPLGVLKLLIKEKGSIL